VLSRWGWNWKEKRECCFEWKGGFERVTKERNVESMLSEVSTRLLDGG
jgi:hypothetical protein